MKIENSTVVMSSSREYDEMDTSSRKRTNFQTKRAGQSENNTRSMDDNTPSVIADRINISHTAKRMLKSNSHMQINRESQIIFANNDDAIEYKQIDAVNKIIGGVIQKEVVLGDVQKTELKTGQTYKINENQTSNVNTQNSWGVSINRTDIHFEEEHTTFNSHGSVKTEDGTEINFKLGMKMNRAFLSESEQQTTMNVWQEKVNLIDPLVINFDGNVPLLSDMTFKFDLDSNGKKEDISFLEPGSGFLAFDKNNDGIINNGRELFGPNTGNGFDELAQFDKDGNMWIDENDEIYSKLSVWTKDQENNNNLTSLKDAGIGAIYLGNAETSFNINKDNNSIKGQIKNTGILLHENGQIGSIQQVDLADRTNEQAKEQSVIDNITKQIDDPMINTMIKKQKEMEKAIELLRADALRERRIEKVKVENNPLETLKKMLDEEISKLKAQLSIAQEDSDWNPVDGYNKSLRRQSGIDIYSTIKNTLQNSLWQ